MPAWAKATTELAWFTGGTVGRETTRRITEAAGAAAVRGQTAEVERSVRAYPPAPLGPKQLVFPVAGACIPRHHGDWAEVRTLAVGAVAPRIEAAAVGAVVDGALGCPKVIDLRAPGAVRIRDFPHAGDDISAMGHTVGADGPLLDATAIAQLLHDLKHSGPTTVMATCARGSSLEPHVERAPPARTRRGPQGCGCKKISHTPQEKYH